ncbi:glycosyltransferase [Niallia sp. XMNu-256]|uniref:glycosyltransferase n=1 Tax=Niallia sp. XMNu-256 TaxID=3082444 RepID=UPI0030CCED74
MKNPRVLFVLDALYVGGTETHVLSLTKELLNNNVYVAIAARKVGSLVQSFESLNCPIYHIEFPNTLNLVENQEEEYISRIVKVMTEENISLVHFHQTPSGYLAGKSAKSLGIPTVLTIHGTYYPKEEIRKLLEISDSVICVSPPLCNYIKSFGVEHPYMVANGIHLEEHSKETSNKDLRKTLNIPSDSIVVLYASRITWGKANVCSIFLRACKDLKVKSIPNLHVIIVGDGNRLDDIRHLAQYIEKICKDSFIHIVGEQRKMHDYYSMADCVVGTGRVALEAMASEKPVVAVGNHGYFGIVTQENIGEAWNYYFGDHGSISPCSRFTLSRDIGKLLSEKEQLPLIGLESREIINERFNIQKTTIEVLKVYSKLLGGERTN